MHETHILINEQEEVKVPKRKSSKLNKIFDALSNLSPQNRLVLLLITLVTILTVVTNYLRESRVAQNNLNSPSLSDTWQYPAREPSDELSDWKTYRNAEYGIKLRYPTNFIIDFDSRGFISGSDYYGKRDFNFLIYDPSIEPSAPGFGKDKEYDGYNFAIFSGKAATNHLKNKQNIINSGKDYSPPVQSYQIEIGGQKHSLYYIPPSDLPNTVKRPWWFISFPLKNGCTMIVTGNYNQNILNQILSTFEFLPDKSDWKTYTNEKYGFETQHYPQSSPKEYAGDEETGQFTYLLLIKFGTVPIKSQYGYSLEINNGKTIDDYRTELVGHITDKVDSEEKITINDNTWTKINYQIFLTTDYVPITTAFINHAGYGYAITSPTDDIDQILSTFKFLENECPEGQIMSTCKLGPCCCPIGALCD